MFFPLVLLCIPLAAVVLAAQLLRWHLPACVLQNEQVKRFRESEGEGEREEGRGRERERERETEPSPAFLKRRSADFFVKKFFTLSMFYLSAHCRLSRREEKERERGKSVCVEER